jgi:transcription elongation factor Elf1
MGRRKKSSKKVIKKKKSAVSTTFKCLHCCHERAVECTINTRDMLGTLKCRVCGEQFQCRTNYLTEPVDIFCEWIDQHEELEAASVQPGGGGGSSSGGGSSPAQLATPTKHPTAARRFDSAAAAASAAASAGEPSDEFPFRIVTNALYAQTFGHPAGKTFAGKAVREGRWRDGASCFDIHWRDNMLSEGANGLGAAYFERV